MTIELTMETPQFAAPGGRVTIAIAVEVTGEPADVERIYIRLEGESRWWVNQVMGPNAVDERTDVHLGGRLAVGSHRFIGEFEVPASMPLSYRGRYLVQLVAHAAVIRGGLRRDRRVSCEIPIRSPIADVGPPQPGVFPNGSYDDRLALSLESARVAVGGAIVGELVASHFDHDRPVEVRVTLSSELESTARLADLHVDRRLHHAEVIRVPSPPTPGGERPPVPIRIVVPPRATPTFDRADLRVRWELVCHALGRIIQRTDVIAPITVVDVGTEPRAVATTYEPTTARIANQFHALVGRGNWSWHETGRSDDAMDRAYLCIEREIGTMTVELAYQFDPVGCTVVARIGYPPLGFGLHVAPSTPFREWLHPDVKAGVPAWDRLYRVMAVDDDRAAAFIGTVVPALVEIRHLGGLVRWTDNELELAQVTNDPDLDAMVDELERVTAALVAALPSVPHDGVYR